jgi:hypothetical protein
MKPKYPNWSHPLSFKEPRRLVIHSDGTISLRHFIWRKRHRWRHGLSEISERDFKRLNPEEQACIRRLEKRFGRAVVVPYEEGPDGTIVWQSDAPAKKKGREIKPPLDWLSTEGGR